MPSGRACTNGSACQPCHAAGAGGPRHGGQPGRGTLQPAGRLDGSARPAAGHPAAGVQRRAVFGGNHEPDRSRAEASGSRGCSGWYRPAPHCRLRRFVCRSGTRCLRWLCWARWRSAFGMPGGCGSICPRRRSAQCWPWGWASGCSQMLCRSIWSAHPTIPASSACRTGRLWVLLAEGRATGAPCRTIWPGAADRSPRWSLTCAPSRRRWNFPRLRS